MNDGNETLRAYDFTSAAWESLYQVVDDCALRTRMPGRFIGLKASAEMDLFWGVSLPVHLFKGGLRGHLIRFLLRSTR